MTLEELLKHPMFKNQPSLRDSADVSYASIMGSNDPKRIEALMVALRMLDGPSAEELCDVIHELVWKRFKARP